MPSTGAIGHAQVSRHANQTDVYFIERVGDWGTHEGSQLRVARFLHRLVFVAVDNAALFVAHWLTSS